MFIAGGSNMDSNSAAAPSLASSRSSLPIVPKAMPSQWWLRGGVAALTAGLFIAFPVGVTCLKFWWLGALLVPEPYTFLVPLSLLLLAAGLVFLAGKLFMTYEQKLDIATALSDTPSLAETTV